MKFKIAGTAILCATALTACQTGGSYYRPLPAQPRVQTIEGTWADSNGLVSTFQGGSFATRTTDTNQLLASGTYAQINDKLIEINLTSMVRNTTSKVNCALVTPSQLNCTSESGGQFSLTRRS
jgi:hypothetical protein